MSKRLEENVRLQRCLQNYWGQVLLFLLVSPLFIGLFHLEKGDERNTAIQVLLAAFCCAQAGKWRSHALAITTLLTLIFAPDWYQFTWLMHRAQVAGIDPLAASILRWAAMAGVLFFSAALLWLKQRYPRTGPARWPVLSILLACSLLIGLTFSGWFSGLAQLAMLTLSWAATAYLWYLAYALTDVSTRNGSPVWLQMATFHPYFSGRMLPVGLGAANLRKRMAQTSQQLAVSQIKAVKLLLNCALMRGVANALAWLRAWAGIPLFVDFWPKWLDGTVHCSPEIAWASLFISFFEVIARASSLGNLLVVCARLGGFQILQHIHNPFAARSLVDYWNRYSFYYKQVVMDLFFYPCYLRFFKTKPRLRHVFAVFMAAGVGNLVFHSRFLLGLASEIGLGATLWGMRNYVCYCVLLCLGLIASQKSLETRPAPPPDFKARLWVLFKIWLFYSFLSLFDQDYSPHSPWRRWDFIKFLFGFAAA